MCLYSVKLTLCALLVIPFFMGLTLIVSPIAKKNILEQAIARAKVNSHLVEGISGIESVKSQGLELVTESKWDNFYKKQIDESFKYSIFTSLPISSFKASRKEASMCCVEAPGVLSTDNLSFKGSATAIPATNIQAVARVDAPNLIIDLRIIFSILIFAILC